MCDSISVVFIMLLLLRRRQRSYNNILYVHEWIRLANRHVWIYRCPVQIVQICSQKYHYWIVGGVYV
jgi:hypothetical protein